MERWDPLDIQGSATSEIVAAARKREIRNILKSYVGFFDPFAELAQNALDAVDLRRRNLAESHYEAQIWIKIDLAKNTLSVTDNGIGFNSDQFRMFLSPSISFKNTGDTRGNKGVGATYLAYGFNFLQMGTKTPDFEKCSEIQKGREWVDDREASVARPMVQDSDPLHDAFEVIDRGSTFTLRFEGDVRPSSLSWIGASSADQWKVLLLLRTPLGQLFEDGNDNATKLHLEVLDKAGKQSALNEIDCKYILPHTVIKGNARIADIISEQNRLLSKGKDASKLPAKYKRLNGVYDFWDSEKLSNLRSDKSERDLIEKYWVEAYGYFCYSAPKVLDKYSDDVAKLRKGIRAIRGGLQLATNLMPQGELVMIPLTSNIGYQNQSHVIVHFRGAEPDLGRKGFQPELESLAKSIAVALVGRLKQWRHLLLTDRGSGGSHQEELQLDEWIEKQKDYERQNPIILQNDNFFVPVNEISISASPTSEQDVVALFNQLLAGGVIRGVKMMASSSHHQYDGLFRYHIRPPQSNHMYDATTNPLGIQDTPNKEGFLSKPYVLEFKHNFDALIADFENEEKHESAIDLAIAWEMGTRWKERYQCVSLLLPDNLHLRQFHGVTHELHDDNTGEKRMDVILLSSLVSYLNDADAEVLRQQGLYGEEK
ncbi:MAG: hypothetical protein MI748_17355 [Opitutales bacterium]|nr:hypothetical protein [Opitutales bacterium]